MRMLFSFAGGTGHFVPMAGLAAAAARRGHAVAFGAQATMLPMLAQAGFAAMDSGGPTFGADAARRDLLALDMAREYRAVRDGFAGRTARARAAGTLRCAAAWRADLLVCDEMDFGAMVAAEAMGLPHAQVLVIASGALAPEELVAAPLAALRAEHGLAPDMRMMGRHLALSPFPPGLRDPACPLPATAQGFRGALPPAGDGGGAIHVTLGTVFNVESGDLFARLLAGLGGLGRELVVTTGRQVDPAELGPQPGHVRVARFIDQAILLPGCALVVCHGGSGTMLAALAHGLPMLLLPMGADQPMNAARAAALGVARVLDAVQAGPAEIGAAAAAVLADPAYRRAAAGMRGEIAALPGIVAAVDRLEALVRSGNRRAAAAPGG